MAQEPPAPEEKSESETTGGEETPAAEAPADPAPDPPEAETEPEATSAEPPEEPPADAEAPVTEPAPPAAGAAGLTADDKLWGLLAHLSGLVCCLVGPLIVWAVKKDQSKFVAYCALLQALTNAIVLVVVVVLQVGAISLIVMLGPIGLIIHLLQFVVGLGYAGITIMWAIQANGGATPQAPVLGDMARQWSGWEG